MDSRQSNTERSFDVMELQNQDSNNNMESTSKETEDGAKKNKQLEHELDPLKMPIILEKVFSYLDPDSIKNARLVNPVWSVEGAKSLITKCYVKIPRDVQMKDSNSTTMSAFEEFLSLKSSDLSMVPNITIEALGDFDLWNSFGVFSPQPKAVKLNNIDADAKLLLNLFNFQPNLKHLNIQDYWLYNKKIISIFKSEMSKEERKGMTLIILNLTLQSCNRVKLSEIKTFLNSTNISVEELKINFHPDVFNPPVKRQVQVMNKVLSNSQNTLKKLTLINCHLYLHLLEFPRMAKLTHMDLDFCPDDFGQISCCKFPPSFRFLDKLPNLREIGTNFEYHSSNVEDFLQHLFKNTGPAPSVKRVKYLYDHENLDVKFLFKIFPNVEDLQTSVDWPCHWWFGSLWTLGTNLRKLRLTFKGNQLYVIFDLDSIFTGFFPKTVFTIMNDPNLEPYSLEKLEQLRVNPSILSLKELEHITIDLDCAGYNLCDYLPRRMLTVAEKYSIRLLPKKPPLTVYIKEGYNAVVANDAMTALEEVSRLANVSVQKLVGTANTGKSRDGFLQCRGDFH